LVFLEAWANGIPNLAYRAGGVAGVIQHETDGLLVPCGDVADLARSLLRLVNSSELRTRLGSHGQGRLVKEFQWKDKLELVRQAYEDLHESSPKRRRAKEASLVGASG